MDLIQRRRIMLAGKRRLLPVGFHGVEFIQSVGRQYINTGYIPNSNTASIVKVDYVIGNNNSFIYGSSRRYDNRAYECYPWDADISFGYGSRISYITGTSGKNGQTVTIYRQREAIELAWEDGTMMTGTNVDTGEFECPFTLTLFALNRYAGITYPNAGNKCFLAKFYDGNVLMRHFVPCVRESDGKPGMYDLCGSICPLTDSPFYINAGTGEFLVGPDRQVPRHDTRCGAAAGGMTMDCDGEKEVSGLPEED